MDCISSRATGINNILASIPVESTFGIQHYTTLSIKETGNTSETPQNRRQVIYQNHDLKGSHKRFGSSLIDILELRLVNAEGDDLPLLQKPFYLTLEIKIVDTVA